eukprot:jgi/Ulvmu1/889/UM100_0044.1
MQVLDRDQHISEICASMSSSECSQPPACAHEGFPCFLRVAEAGDLVLVAPGGEITVPASAVLRSTILCTLIDSHTTGETIPLPFCLEAFIFWLASACRWSEAHWMHRGQQMPAAQLVNALTAADALADQETLEEVCHSQRTHVAHALAMLHQLQTVHHRGLCGHPSLQAGSLGAGADLACMAADWILQVLMALPPDVTVVLLRAAVPSSDPAPLHFLPRPISIPPALTALPEPLHHLAMRACAPCIDTDLSLSLELDNRSVLSFAASTISTLTTLTSLTLQLSFVSYVAPTPDLEALLRAACHLPRLVSLRLLDIGFTCQSAQALAQHLPAARGLRALELWNTMFAAGSTGVCALVSSLWALPSLTKLELGGGGSKQANALILKRALPGLCALRALRWVDARLSDNDAAEIAEAAALLPRLGAITLKSVNPKCGGGTRLAAALGKMQGLQEVSVCCEGNGGLGAVLAWQLGRCSGVTRLELDRSMHHDDIRHVGQALMHMKALRHLSMCEAQICQDSRDAKNLAVGISRLSHLSHIDLSRTFMCASGVRTIAFALRACSALRVLRLNDLQICQGLPAHFADCLEGTIASLTELRELHLRNCCMPSCALTGAVAPLTCLRVLRITGAALGDEGAAALAASLRHAARLEVLDVSHSEVHDRGMAALCPVLRKMSSLRELVLAGNRIWPEGAAALAWALRPCMDLGSVSGGDSTLSDTGVYDMQTGSHRGADAADTGPEELQLLDLSYCGVGPSGLEALAPALLQLSSLREVNMHGLPPAGGRVAMVVERLRIAHRSLYVGR